MVVERGTDFAHQSIPIVSPFLTFQHVAVNVGNHGVGVHKTVMDVGNDYVGIYRKLGLQVNGQR